MLPLRQGRPTLLVIGRMDALLLPEPAREKRAQGQPERESMNESLKQYGAAVREAAAEVCRNLAGAYGPAEWPHHVLMIAVDRIATMPLPDPPAPAAAQAASVEVGPFNLYTPPLPEPAQADELAGTAVTEAAIATVMRGIIDGGDAELRGMARADLERYWHFRWDIAESVYWNVYQFHSLLDLYGSFCRRWESMHNGNFCIVERVRDTYLMPKIGAFVGELLQADTAELRARLAAAETMLKELRECASYWSEHAVPVGIVDRLDATIAKVKDGRGGG